MRIDQLNDRLRVFLHRQVRKAQSVITLRSGVPIRKSLAGRGRATWRTRIAQDGIIEWRQGDRDVPPQIPIGHRNLIVDCASRDR